MRREYVSLIQSLTKVSKKNPKRIAYSDGESDRVIEAIKVVQRKKLAIPFLIGDEQKIKLKLKDHGLKDNFVDILDPRTSPFTQKAIVEFVELLKHKKLTKANAKKLLLIPEYFGAMLVHLGIVDAMIGGATSTTADTLRPAFQIIKTKEKDHMASALFIMELKNKTYFFADCAVNVSPNAKTLSEIALDSAQTVRSLGIEPRVALLSFSTHSSYEGKEVDHIKKALELIKKKDPSLIVDGEMQVDAAIVPDVARRKSPNSIIKGDANILIFPDLNSGNIACKLVERLANARAVGPIIQGLRKPINDLSRGCSIQDIIDLTIVTCVEAQKQE